MTCTVHHTVGVRQQRGTAKLHRDPDCQYLRSAAAVFSEQMGIGNTTDRMRCSRCWPQFAGAPDSKGDGQ
ncbi:hypothetical protein FBZ85_106205 [Azospirillum brasilense]|nr:hypothetical protein FBZ85_106205 [Azospirillum brasilense]